MKRNKGLLERRISDSNRRKSEFLEYAIEERNRYLLLSLINCVNVPGLATRHENVHIVVNTENTEVEYSDLEHEVVPGVVDSLKVIFLVLVAETMELHKISLLKSLVSKGINSSISLRNLNLEVERCLCLLKRLSAKDFKETGKKKLLKFGKSIIKKTEQTLELPVDNQIYDMVDVQRYKVLVVMEVSERLGIDKKKSYSRLYGICSRFKMHLQAESHKKTRVF